MNRVENIRTNLTSVPFMRYGYLIFKKCAEKKQNIIEE